MFCGGKDLRCGMHEHPYHMWHNACMYVYIYPAKIAYEIEVLGMVMCCEWHAGMVGSMSGMVVL